MKNLLVKTTLSGWASPLTTSYVYSQAVMLDGSVPADQRLGVDTVIAVDIGDADSVETKYQISEDGITFVDWPALGDELEHQVTGDDTYILKSGPLSAKYVRLGVKATGTDVDPSSVTATLYYREAAGDELSCWAGDRRTATVRASAVVDTSATQSDPIRCKEHSVWKDLGIDFYFAFTIGSLTNVQTELQASYDGGSNWVNYPYGDGTDTDTYTASVTRYVKTGPVIADMFRWQWNASGTQTGSDLVITAYWSEGK